MFRFEKNEGIIILAATNRRDYLDSALLRPGRFDSEVHISPPDLRGRKEIFELYLSKVTHDPTTDTEYLAKGTTGFTGADIENMVNQVCHSNINYPIIQCIFRLHFMLLKSVPQPSI